MNETISISIEQNTLEDSLHRLHHERLCKSYSEDKCPFLLNPHDALQLEILVSKRAQPFKHELSLLHIDEITYLGRKVVVKASGEAEIALSRDLAMCVEWKNQLNKKDKNVSESN